MQTHLSSPNSSILSTFRFFTSDVGMQDMIVFSHLRWDFVTQRPQHLISRLSAGRKVLFIEEPIPFTKDNRLSANIRQVSDSITVIQPRISWDNLIDELEPIVSHYSEKYKLSNPVLWFYSPMFVDIAHRLSYSRIVYDCMDELSAFAGAPANLIENERKLLSIADVVFTGGKSLYESKKQVHSNVYCFPSSVDTAHFKKSILSQTKIPTDMAHIKPPVVGFYGVIDERLDLQLLTEVAKRKAEVSFVMIGPVVKIDEASLPRQKNIFYLGQKDYKELPSYLKGFDIAMMPFALNEATKYISPTKTLEFMAAKKPIISTPIYDVVRDYKNEVAIVSSVDEFCAAIDSYLSETSSARKIREQRMEDVLKRSSWDSTAARMESIILDSPIASKPLQQPTWVYSS